MLNPLQRIIFNICLLGLRDSKIKNGGQWVRFWVIITLREIKGVFGTVAIVTSYIERVTTLFTNDWALTVCDFIGICGSYDKG